MQPVMTADQIMSMLDREFPQIHAGGRVYSIDSVSSGEAVVRLSANDLHLRPGGTVSGPSMMALADLAAYVVILAHIARLRLLLPPISTSIFCASRNRAISWRHAGS
jgi:acyl-coenzyme A thioesterase PaaI-like protein